MDPLWSFLNGSSSPQGHLFASTCRPHAVTWCSSQDPSRTHEDVLWQLSHLWTQLGIMRPRRAGGTKTSGHTWGTGGRVPSPQCWLWVLCWGTRHSILLILVEWGPLPRTHTTRAGAGGRLDSPEHNSVKRLWAGTRSTHPGKCRSICWKENILPLVMEQAVGRYFSNIG